MTETRQITNIFGGTNIAPHLLLQINHLQKHKNNIFQAEKNTLACILIFLCSTMWSKGFFVPLP